jgi:hypothetical protein
MAEAPAALCFQLALASQFAPGHYPKGKPRNGVGPCYQRYIGLIILKLMCSGLEPLLSRGAVGWATNSVVRMFKRA